MWKIFLILTVSIGLLILIKKKTPQTKKDEYTRYIYQKELLTTNEANFFQELQKILPPGIKISCKCRLEDMIGIKNGPQKQTLRNKVKCRHIDFTLHDESGKIYYAIELDDKSHGERPQDDKIKNEIMNAAGIHLIRIKARVKYNPEEIYREIHQEIKLG